MFSDILPGDKVSVKEEKMSFRRGLILFHLRS